MTTLKHANKCGSLYSILTQLLAKIVKLIISSVQYTYLNFLLFVFKTLTTLYLSILPLPILIFIISIWFFKRILSYGPLLFLNLILLTDISQSIKPRYLIAIIFYIYCHMSGYYFHGSTDLSFSVTVAMLCGHTVAIFLCALLTCLIAGLYLYFLGVIDCFSSFRNFLTNSKIFFDGTFRWG